MHNGLFEDLLVADIGLDQSPEAGNDGICLFIELKEETQRRTSGKDTGKDMHLHPKLKSNYIYVYRSVCPISLHFFMFSR